MKIMNKLPLIKKGAFWVIVATSLLAGSFTLLWIRVVNLLGSNPYEGGEGGAAVGGALIQLDIWLTGWSLSLLSLLAALLFKASGSKYSLLRIVSALFCIYIGMQMVMFLVSDNNSFYLKPLLYVYLLVWPTAIGFIVMGLMNCFLEQGHLVHQQWGWLWSLGLISGLGIILGKFILVPLGFFTPAPCQYPEVCIGVTYIDNASTNIGVVYADGTKLRCLTCANTMAGLPAPLCSISKAVSQNLPSCNKPAFDVYAHDDYHPAWSPDATKVAFISESGESNNLYVVNADGSKIRQIITENASSPTWSPDGTHIAFINHGIGVVEADGSNLRWVTINFSSYDRDPAWSPDGTHIAFVSNRDGNEEIYVMEADGSNLRRLTDDPAGDADPAWSPDGTHIAYTSERGIYVMEADGSNLRQMAIDPMGLKHPAWSPDGTHIAFVSNSGIFVVEANGSKLWELRVGTPNNGPLWSPDGKWIAYTNFEREIYIVDADGLGLRQLSTPRLVDDFVWLPIP
jgi:Tol biopolymer transport system component